MGWRVCSRQNALVSGEYILAIADNRGVVTESGTVHSVAIDDRTKGASNDNVVVAVDDLQCFTSYETPVPGTCLARTIL